MTWTNEKGGAGVEVYHQKRGRKSKKKVQYKTGMISCGGIEHINPDEEEIDFTQKCHREKVQWVIKEFPTPIPLVNTEEN